MRRNFSYAVRAAAGSDRKQIPQRAIENRIQKRSGTLMVQVRSPSGSGTISSYSELAQIARRDLERFAASPLSGRSRHKSTRSLPGKLRIHGILEHVHAIPHGNRQRAAEPPSP